MNSIVVCALYKFVKIENYKDLQALIYNQMVKQGVRGTLLLAEEGINGTIAGLREGIDNLLHWLRSDPRLSDLDCKESFTDSQPFNRTKVKIKKEIVTMGVENIDPQTVVGTYVSPKDWNQLIADPETLLIDTRNDYEYQLGTFKHAVNPATQSFREFPEYIKNQLNPAVHRKVAMFCTGGIRCEKSTAYLKQQGFDEVYHLKGGILKYLEEIPEQESLWKGECFVFDDRVTVTHRLEKGHYDRCNACGAAVSAEDKRSAAYQPNISCPHCHDKTPPEKQLRFKARARQIAMAEARGQAHLGSEAMQIRAINKARKLQHKEASRKLSLARAKQAELD